MTFPQQSKKILVTGGSGYLGRFLARELSSDHDVAFTYATTRIHIPRCNPLWLDFLHPETVDSCLREFQPDIVVHAAALADGGQCEASPEKARAINVTGTEQLLLRLQNPDALFIYISTDLVFDGTNAPYDEQAIPNPLGIYGKTKRCAELLVQSEWQNHVILRCALMYGPKPSSGKGSFLQWMDKTFREQESISLFIDEFRTPVYVKDVVRAVSALIQTDGSHRLYHIGGPERISRVDFGKRLAAIRGYDPLKIKGTRIRDLDTGFLRPADVSLDSSRIQHAYPISLTLISDALHEIFVQ
ncbi:MAG: SDR family oxidoreductase [Candidatus Omnitrophota bacterium]|jgi:dTDP-4-dehydrorhamnose reductase|nr:MAG: SDR family oxidoreductase [Candidatus Omnitrophota bacterium]